MPTERPGRSNGDGTTLPGGSEKAPASNSEKTILFAGDDGRLRTFVAALLDSLGYKVIVASDGLRTS